MKELKLKELSVRQKLGMSMIALMSGTSDENVEYILELIRNHSLGGVWINWPAPNRNALLAKVKETADYPILIMCDAEGGISNLRIGKHNAIGCSDSEELAYMFGKVVGVTARQLGYNTVCDPILDIAEGNVLCGGTIRSLGSDKYKITKLAKAEAKGFHDSGILTIGKHYPGESETDLLIDSHMAEVSSQMTEEELVDKNLYPYIELIKEDLLDGIMSKHARFTNIDPDYPASLSKKMINIIREKGMNGIAITDALTMMGVIAKFGRKNSIGLSVANGNDMALPYGSDHKEAYEFLCEFYDEGRLSDERLDEAVSRVLVAQHKTLAAPVHTALTTDDYEKFERMNTDTTFAYTDAGVSVALPKDKRHLFIILTETPVDISRGDEVAVDTLDKDWYHVMSIVKKLEGFYPDCGATTLSIFPAPAESKGVLEKATEYDDVVFITFFNSTAYLGKECFTSRVISVMEAMQVTDTISTIVHFGNPYVLEDVPHVPRIIVGTTGSNNMVPTFEVLAGEREPKGVPTYKIKLK